MIKIPRIALFPPIESMASVYSPLFRKQSEYSIRNVNSTGDILELISDEDMFDAIVIPSTLADRSGAVTACIQIKAEERLISIPIVVLSFVKDKPAIQAFYGSGADIVLTQPFDAELTYLQISALSRQTRAIQEEIGVSRKDKGLRQAIISALHFAEDALIIIDTQFKPVFANNAARTMLKIFNADDHELESQVFGQLENLLKTKSSEIDALHRKGPAEDATLKISGVKLNKANRQNFSADLRLSLLRAAGTEATAYCLGIKDISTPAELSNTLLQTERVHSLSLLLASGCMRLLGSPNLGLPGSPLSKVERLFLGEPRVCSLLTTTTGLLELLDVIVSAQASVKVDIRDDHVVAMSSSDLFQLAGHLILYAIRYSSSQGMTILSVEPVQDRKSVTLTVRSSQHTGFSSQNDDQIAAVIRGQLAASSTDPRSHEANKISLGISIASRIARAYGTRILHSRPSEQEIKLQVALPLSAGPLSAGPLSAGPLSAGSTPAGKKTGAG